MIRAPKGIEIPKNYTSRHGSLPTALEVPPGAKNKQFFTVKPKFVKLENGVRFNVEEVVPALPEHKNKSHLSRQEFLHSMKAVASNAYPQLLSKTKVSQNLSRKEKKQLMRKFENMRITADSIKLEAVSEMEDKLVYAGADGFFKAAVHAFAQHLPLIISPDDIWTLISYAFAMHVDQNAEALRHHFVKHEGKKRIVVETSTDFKPSIGGSPDTGATAEDWETQVFNQFSERIRSHIGDKVHSAVVSDFTTTSATTKVSSEIGLMAAMRHYFSYGMVTTICGIPEITLLGKEEDWVSIVERAKFLGALMTEDFSNWWMPKLLPVLEKFVETFRGKVDHSFWQTFIKLRHTPRGSGYKQFMSGWIQILFPYLSNSSPNIYLREWNKMFFSGPNPQEIPPIVSSAPFDWRCPNCHFKLHCHAGFVGFTQDEEGRLKASIGWFVTHDPQLPPEAQMAQVQKEIDDLLRGNYSAELELNDYKGEEWYLRVKHLMRVEEQLLDQLQPTFRRNAETKIANRVQLT